MPLSSSHWFRVTGSETFLLLMMVMALFSVQSSMADRLALTLSESSLAPNSSQLNVAPHLKWASLRNDSHSSTTSSTTSATVSTNSTTTSTTSAPSTTSPPCKDNHCDNCDHHSVCANHDNLTCTCDCEMGYLPGILATPSSYPRCAQYNCTYFRDPTDDCFEYWSDSHCENHLCVCNRGFEPGPGTFRWLECQPIPDYWTTTTTTTSSTTSVTVSSSSTSAPSSTTPGCKYNLCGNCSQHSVCVNQDGVTCNCICELGYHITDLNSPCTLFGCIVYDNVNEPMDSCIWNNSYCIASEQLCVCKPGFESRQSGDDFECQPIPGWTSSTTQATVSTSSSPPSTSTPKLSSTSTASSKLVVMITGILIACLLPVALIGVVYCYCQEKRKAIGGGATRGNSSATLQGGEALPGAYYRRQPAPSPPGASTFKSAASKSSGKAMSKQNDAQAVPSKSAIQAKVSTL